MFTKIVELLQEQLDNEYRFISTMEGLENHESVKDSQNKIADIESSIAFISGILEGGFEPESIAHWVDGTFTAELKIKGKRNFQKYLEGFNKQCDNCKCISHQKAKKCMVCERPFK